MKAHDNATSECIWRANYAAHLNPWHNEVALVWSGIGAFAMGIFDCCFGMVYTDNDLDRSEHARVFKLMTVATVLQSIFYWMFMSSAQYYRYCQTPADMQGWRILTGIGLGILGLQMLVSVLNLVWLAIRVKVESPQSRWLRHAWGWKVVEAVVTIALSPILFSIWACRRFPIWGADPISGHQRTTSLWTVMMERLNKSEQYPTNIRLSNVHNTAAAPDSDYLYVAAKRMNRFDDSDPS